MRNRSRSPSYPRTFDVAFCATIAGGGGGGARASEVFVAGVAAGTAKIIIIIIVMNVPPHPRAVCDCVRACALTD